MDKYLTKVQIFDNIKIVTSFVPKPKYQFGAVCFFLLALGDGSLGFSMSGTAWEAIVALALFSTVLPGVLFLMGLMRLGPVRTAIVSTVEPFLTALLGAMVLRQAITITTLLGGAMIVSAVVLLQFRRERVA